MYPRERLPTASDSGSGTLVVVDPVRAAAVDEVDLAASPGQYPNPLAPAFVGLSGYVPLYGSAAAPSYAAAPVPPKSSPAGSVGRWHRPARARRSDFPN